MDTPTIWPFGLGALAAAMRRLLDVPDLAIETVTEVPGDYGRASANRVRGVEVRARRPGHQFVSTHHFILKEPLGASRKGLAGVGRREAGFYRYLAPEVPLHTPAPIAFDSVDGRWFLFHRDNLDYSFPNWPAETLIRALDDLVVLHDRFWGLGVDLANFPWLSRPLSADFPVHMMAAVSAFELMARENTLPGFSDDIDNLRTLGAVLTQADAVVAQLNTVPDTLLHGAYSPRIIGTDEDGDHIIGDWQHVGIGPGVIDLVTFIAESRWWSDDGLPVAPNALITLYRAQLARHNAWQPSDEDWALLWDCALLWVFAADWLELIAHLPAPIWQARRPLLEAVWLHPVLAAVRRRFPGAI